MARARKAAETVIESAPVVEETKPKVRKADPKECGCGYGLMTRGSAFVIGHDMKRKSALLTAFDAGDESADAELVELAGGGPRPVSPPASSTDPPLGPMPALRTARQLGSLSSTPRSPRSPPSGPRWSGRWHREPSR